MQLYESLAADFRIEVPATRRILEVVPDGKLDWKPHTKSMTLGRLAGHIAELPAFAHAMIGGDLDFAAGKGEWKPFAPADRKALLAGFDEKAAAFEKIVAGKDDAFLNQTWRMRVGEKILVSLPRHVAIRSMVIHHMIHHRGQLSAYLRLLDVPLPSIYGPTADTPPLF